MDQVTESWCGQTRPQGSGLLGPAMATIGHHGRKCGAAKRVAGKAASPRVSSRMRKKSVSERWWELKHIREISSEIRMLMCATSRDECTQWTSMVSEMTLAKVELVSSPYANSFMVVINGRTEQPVHMFRAYLHLHWSWWTTFRRMGASNWFYLVFYIFSFPAKYYDHFLTWLDSRSRSLCIWTCYTWGML